MYVKLDPNIIDIICCPLCKGSIEMINQKFICKDCLTEYPSRSLKQGESEERVFDFRIHRPDYCLPSGLVEWSDVQEGYKKRHFEDSKCDNLNKYLNEIDSVREIYTKEFNIKGKVLDVGGHQGRLRYFLRADDVPLYVSVDPFINVFQDFESQPNLLKAYPCLSKPCNFLACYAESLPFLANTFDWVHMRSALDHFQDPYLALKEAYRVLKPEGTLLIGSVVYGGKSSLKAKGRNNFLQLLVSRAACKLQIDGVKSLATIMIKRIISRGRYSDRHAFHWSYEDLIDLLNISKFVVVKEHWQKPPFTMCLYMRAKKVGLISLTK